MKVRMSKIALLSVEIEMMYYFMSILYVAEELCSDVTCT
jgi:hypothetical protein